MLRQYVPKNVLNFQSIGNDAMIYLKMYYHEYDMNYQSLALIFYNFEELQKFSLIVSKLPNIGNYARFIVKIEQNHAPIWQ